MTGYDESVKFGVVAATQHDQIHYGINYSKEAYANNPSQIINYVSCHDDLCLVDKIAFLPYRSNRKRTLEILIKLAQTVVITSQGVPFIYGEEVLRNKQGVHNLSISDNINQIDWNFKKSNQDILITIRG